MFPLFSYIGRPSLLVILVCLPIFPARNFSDDRLESTAAHGLPNATWIHFTRFLDAGRGSRHDGMIELKHYFRRFGYLPSPPENDRSTAGGGFTDIFDETFEEAVLFYQRNLGLSQTGKLDYETMKSIVSPRCGVPDSKHSVVHHRLKTTRKFSFFYGQPRWTRSSMLTYAFSPTNTIDYVSRSDLRAVFRRAFARWSAVIPVNFTEAEDYSYADIKIGWYSGDHSDGEPFDGVLGVLAHSFSPENGRFHLDAAERWAVDFDSEKSKVAVDLESVATHEIGHLLGLAHSSNKEAVMYPNLSPRTKKTELRIDDLEGIQELYGSNPNFRYDSRLESDTSSSCGMDLERRKRLLKWTSASVAMVVCCLSLVLLAIGARGPHAHEIL